MIERLTGSFQKMIRVGSDSEFINIINECARTTNGSICRLHIYPYSPASRVIVIFYIKDGKVMLLGFDPNSSTFVPINKNAIKEFVNDCHVEVYRLSESGVAFDMDVINHAARIKGVERLLEEYNIEEIIEVLTQDKGEKAGGREPHEPGTEAVSEVPCDIVIRNVIGSFTESGISEVLSSKLSDPSTIAKILLYSEEYVIASKECRDLYTYIKELMRDKENIAVKLEVGDYSVWLVKAGESSGIHDYMRGRPATSGSGVIEHWDKVRKLLNGAISGKKKVSVYIYTIPKDTFKR